jgi:hypothetical protein
MIDLTHAFHSAYRRKQTPGLSRDFGYYLFRPIAMFLGGLIRRRYEPHLERPFEGGRRMWDMF